MKVNFHTSYLLGINFAKLVKKVDKHIEILESLRLQKKISEGTFLNIFLLWQDLIDNTKEELDKKVELFCIEIKGTEDNDVREKQIIKKSQRKKYREININTVLGNQYFIVISELNNAYETVYTLFLNGKYTVETVVINDFIMFVKNKYDEINNATIELERVLRNVQKNSR